jgi:glycerate kinase
MRILVAPDKFKGSLTAERAANALARGARRIHPDASFVIRPIADGGEGTVDAFALASGGRIREAAVSGPLGEEVSAPIAVLESGSAVVEMASASGLPLIEPSPKAALLAHSSGTGQLIRAATEIEDMREVIVGIGGSASTDGGTGAARALGWRFLDASDTELSLGGGDLHRLARIERPAVSPPNVSIVAACDVNNPLIGGRGAARSFARQKGADDEGVERLELGLETLAQIIDRDLGIDVSSIPSGGAGGGMGAGAVAFFGATLELGFDLLARASHLAAEVKAADLVITGEGRIDETSLQGKAPIALARLAQRHGTQCFAVAGDLQLANSELRKNGVTSVVGLLQSGGGELAERDPEAALERAISGLLEKRLEKKQGRRLLR